MIISLLCEVAPHAGTWVETSKVSFEAPNFGVAPHAGAWVETVLIADKDNFIKSRPMRARGLKLHLRSR